LDKYEIIGGTPLNGTVTVSGAKNAAVAILPAAILVEGKCRVENVPDISDVRILLDILRAMGAKISQPETGVVELDCTDIHTVKPDPALVRRMRASYYLMGALMSRFGQAEVALPGGCNFAARPIDQHVKGFRALGAKVDETPDCVYIEPGPRGLKGNRVSLDVVSVGATVNIIMAATLLPGQTVIENAAKEPHIVDLANFLNTCGAKISGAGTDTIKIKGVEKLHGCSYAIIPDMIEAGTYMLAAAATKGSLKIKNVIPKHLESITAKLAEMGVEVIDDDESVTVTYRGTLNRINVKTMPYPGFPTDMQPQMGVLLCLAEGVSLLSEGVYDNRFRYVEELKRMGAIVKVDGRTAVIEGVSKLSPAQIKAMDLRAGAAMVIAGLASKGVTEVEDIHHIERGYDDIVGKLRMVGADIKKVSFPDEESAFVKAN